MYAVIQSGGKQYRVAEKDTVTVEHISANAGEMVEISKVLMVADGDKISFGKAASSAKVTAKVLAQTRGKKLLVAKFKRRKGYFNRVGHRQSLTTLSIEKISI